MRVTLAFIGALLFLPIVSAQSPTQRSQPAAASARQAYSVPRTPWGDPDLQGLWPSIDMQGTPYERPETFGARAVLNEDESELLGVPLHSPAFLFERTTRSPEGQIVEYVRSIYRGDRYRLVTELSREVRRR